jgi:hypothetical protein
MKNFLPAKNSLFAAVFSRHKFKPFRPEILAAACGLVVALTALPAHAQNCAPPPAGLVGWWPLEETAGTAVADRSPLGQNPGTVSFSNGASTSIGTGSQSTPKSVTGFVGNGMNFYFGSRVNVKKHSSLDFGKNKSFEKQEFYDRRLVQRSYQPDRGQLHFREHDWLLLPVQ